MTSRRVLSLERVLYLCRLQEHGAEIAVQRSAQSVASTRKLLLLLKTRQASELPPFPEDDDLIHAERLLTAAALTQMRESTLQRLTAARQEHITRERELAERRRVVEQVKDVLDRIQADMERTSQRREQQEADDLYAARIFARSKIKDQS